MNPNSFLFGLYVLYTAYLAPNTGASPAVPAYSKVVGFGVRPVVVLLILGTAIYEFRHKPQTAA